MGRTRLVGAIALAASLVLVVGVAAQGSVSHRASQTHALRGSSRAISARAARGAHAPAANWVSAANTKTGINENGGGAALGTKVYVPGGFTDTADTQALMLGVMQVYNNNTNKWAKEAELMPTVFDGTSPAGWADAAVCADPQAKKIYVVNGVDGAFLYAATQVYDATAPLGTRWSYGPIPVLASDGITTFFSQDSGCFVNQGKLYLFGGYAAIGDPSDPNLTAALTKTTWVLDIATGQWSDTLKPMKRATLWFGYTTDGKAGYVAGGTNDLSTFIPVTNVQKFKPTTGWGGLHALPVGLLAPGMGIYGTGSSAVPAVFGGGEWDAVNSQFLLHQDTITCGLGCTPTGAGWADLGLDLVTHRWFLASATAGGKLYAVGGIGVPNGPPEVLRSAEKSS